MSGRNPAKGTVPCPVTGCGQVCPVYQFADRSSSDARRRKAGKFYLDCSAHGRLGFDGSAWIQEHVLANITWHDDRKAAASDGGRSESAPASAPAAATSSAPSARPAVKERPKAAPKEPIQQPRKRWWELL